MRMTISLSQSIEPRIQLKQLIASYPRVIKEISDYFRGYEGQVHSGVSLLQGLLAEIPQKQKGKLMYVVAGGWAVEILSGKPREHGNINVLVLDKDKPELSSNRCLDYYGVEYLDRAVRKALPKKDAVKARWERGNREVYVPSAEFIIGTKLLPRSLQERNRDKDIEDILTLLNTNSKREDRLARVLNSFPYVQNGEAIASFVDKIGAKLRGARDASPARLALEAVSDVLYSQLREYSKPKSI